VLHRERDRLISERVQHVNRIKGLCTLQGIYNYHPLRPQAMVRLEQLRTAQGGALPQRAPALARVACGIAFSGLKARLI
jgi:transposase